MLKELLAKFALGALLLSTLTIGAFAGAPSYFTDVEPYIDNYQAIDYLRSNDIVIGYEDETFKPEQNINRAEFLKIVMEMLEIEPGGEGCFEDVADQWFAEYVCMAQEEGIIDGYPDGTFKPGDEISFVEAAKIISNIFELEIGETEGKEWFYDYVMALDGASVIPYSVADFGDKITRGDMAEMVWRIDNEVTYKVSNTYSNIAAGKVASEKGGELQRFESCEELTKYLDVNKESYFAEMGAFAMDDDFEESASEPMALKSAVELDGGAAADYSSTNVQVQGVDEADVLKNDGKYIYYLKDDELKIISAYPPASMEELDSYSFADEDFYATEIYVDGNKAVVIGMTYGYWINRGNYSDGETRMYVLDISDKTNIEEDRVLTFAGYYSDSRKVGDTVYLVMNQYNYYWDEIVAEEALPYFMDGDGDAEALVGCGDIRYVPGAISTTDYLLVSAIDIGNNNSKVEAEVILGSYGSVYSSPDNLYIAEPRYDYWYWYDESGTGEETYIHKFELDGTDLDYEGVGTVPGSVDDQFSMDEEGNFFRIATTTGGWWSEDGPENNVYVLDKSLDIVGSLTGLAPGEEIYSARFMGDRLYLVTFEQIDPLFVIDLSTPNNPHVLGQLKIPGVSEYLHPLDENHIIGFGKETLSASELENAGWSWFQGLKLSLFDVTNVNSPREVDKVVIGDRGSSSELLWNHKALLYNAKDGYMAFPVLLSEIPDAVKDDLDASWIYGDYTYQGAYVYNVNTSGFSFRGKVSHYDADELGDNFNYYYSYGDDKDISRVLYMGDYIYSVSDYMVKANTETDLTEVESILWE